MTITLAAADAFNWNNLVTLMIAILVAWNTYQSKKRDKKISEVSERVNGLTKKLVDAEKIISKAEGKIEERAEEAARKDNQ